MKKLFIDLEKCYKCGASSACSSDELRNPPKLINPSEALQLGGQPTSHSPSDMGQMPSAKTGKKCAARCSYYFHPENDGYIRCIALGVQEHVCRRCEEPPCVASCPQNALGQREADLRLERYSMRCTSCKTCTAACPFGVIIPEIVEYKTTMCDYCFDRSDDKTPPICTQTCPEGALEWKEVNEDPKQNIYAVRDGLFYVRTIKWKE